MTQALTFNDIILTPIPHQNSLWIRAAELARALGYCDESKVSRLYRRNAEEFTPEMTQIIEISAEAQNGLLGSAGRCRIFSLRGCHLVAMFARTPVAKAFRRWVLDVLEKYAAEQAALSAAPGPEASAASLPLSTTEDRKPLRALVGSWAKLANAPFDACWNQLKAAFQLANIRELPQAWLPDALAWVQEKIDALPAPLPQAQASAAAPVAPGKQAAQAVGSVRIGASDLSARQDAMRRISKVQWQLAAAIDVLRLFCNPKAHPDQCGEMSLEMASNLYTTAHASLVSAYNALEAAERLQHGRM